MTTQATTQEIDDDTIDDDRMEKVVNDVLS